MNYVYVLDKDGKPLMPTRRYGWVRRTLKSSRARAVTTVPFTIRLTYEPETHVVQDITLGIDPGRTNIGLAAVTDDGRCLYSAHCAARNKEVPKLMAERRQHRQASRRGERLARKRLAKCLGTTRQSVMERMLPGYGKPVQVKDIINTEARFNNRRHPEGWLMPTAMQLLQTHISLVRKARKILLVTKVCLELNRFAFMELEAGGKLASWQYQQGSLYGYSGIRHALEGQQGGKCLLCGKRLIEHDHHLIPQSKNGSDTLANMAGLCSQCHDLVHKDAGAAEKLAKRKAGINKKYHALSVLNQIIPYLAQKLEQMFGAQGFFVTMGWNTRQFRDNHNIDKDHDIDAYCIACSAMETVRVLDVPKESYEIRQFRRHSRAEIHHQTERAYGLDGVTVAKNRRKREEQKTDALEDWFQAMENIHGRQEAERMRSRLSVKKSTRYYNDMDRDRPGAVFVFQGKPYVLTGQLTGGQYYRAYGQENRNFPVKKCGVVQKNAGLVYV